MHLTTEHQNRAVIQKLTEMRAKVENSTVMVRNFNT